MKRFPIAIVLAIAVINICTGCPEMMPGMGMMDPPVVEETTPRVFGDGSAGAKVVNADETLLDANPQYTDFVVEEGVTLTIASGAVIRVTGTFTNRGTIVVNTGAEGADRTGFDSTTLDGSTRPPQAGFSTRAAGSGEIGGSAAGRSAGVGGDGLSEFESRVTLRLGVNAGGGGGAGRDAGGDGGGALTVIAFGKISNDGVIRAEGGDGSSGAGGGGGGAIILASKTNVTIAHGATLSTCGGAGGGAADGEGPGGGGGGGIVHAIAPEIVNAGAVDVTGGAAGAGGADGSVTASIRSGGGGGGAGAGKGGDGGGVSSGASADPSDAGAGASGFWLMTTADPTSLL
jgi:hypothetical protein